MSSSGSECESTYSATERKLAELWSEVLGTSQLPNSNDDFFALGGDSMTMLTVEYRIQEVFSVELPAGAVAEAPSLAELSAVIDAAQAAPVGTTR